MTKSKPYKSILLAIALLLPAALLALTMPSQAFSQVDDEYLKELDAEAKSSVGVSKKSTQPAASTTATGTSESASKSEQDDIANFEKLLQFERPSTYHFFTRLTQSEKLNVIKDYNSHKKLIRSSTLIFDLYFKHKN